MRKIHSRCIAAIFFAALLFSKLPCYSQQLNDSTFSHYTAMLEKGKDQRTAGIVLFGIGVACFAAIPLMHPEVKSGSFNIMPSTGQMIAFVGGLGFTVGGIVAFASGSKKMNKARLELGKTSYYLYPGASTDGLSLGLKFNPGR